MKLEELIDVVDRANFAELPPKVEGMYALYHKNPNCEAEPFSRCIVTELERSFDPDASTEDQLEDTICGFEAMQADLDKIVKGLIAYKAAHRQWKESTGWGNFSRRHQNLDRTGS